MCDKCASPCDGCNNTSLNTDCISCISAHVLVGINCLSCSLNCLNCTSTTLCYLCNVTYYIDANSSCTACPIYC